MMYCTLRPQEPLKYGLLHIIPAIKWESKYYVDYAENDGEYVVQGVSSLPPCFIHHAREEALPLVCCWLPVLIQLPR